MYNKTKSITSSILCEDIKLLLDAFINLCQTLRKNKVNLKKFKFKN